MAKTMAEVTFTNIASRKSLVSCHSTLETGGFEVRGKHAELDVVLTSASGPLPVSGSTQHLLRTCSPASERIVC